MEVLKLETWTDEFGEDQLNLDKLKEYLDFIVEAVDHYDPSRYSEWHHVMPKCIDKEKKFRDQGVRINGADHFRAHMKLVECFSGRSRRLLSFALTKMLGHLNGLITPEDYEKARQLNSEALRGNQNAKGHKHTAETRRVMSQKHRDHDSEETKLRRSQSLLGHEVSDETREKLRSFNLGRTASEETREKLRLAATGRKHTKETLEKMSISQSGKNNAMYGVHHSEESRIKMSQSRKGNQNAKGNIWITDGISNKVIRDLSDLPDGWSRGRTLSKKGKGDYNEVS